MNIIAIHKQLAGIAPIRGVGSTGRIDFEDSATNQERAAATAKFAELIDAPDVVDYLALAEAHIGKYFTAYALLDGLQKLLPAQAAGRMEDIPKTVAVSGWVEMVKAMALANRSNFPPAPYTFAETLAE